MSNILANISNTVVSNPLPLDLRALAQLQQSNSITDQQSVALFSGAVIQGGQFSVTLIIILLP